MALRYKCTLNDVMIQEIDSLSIKKCQTYGNLHLYMYHLINVFGHENEIDIRPCFGITRATPLK